MRQVFALVTEEYVQYALVDDDSGELTQFAQIKTPVQFGLAEAAVLGTNLIEALGLNSPKRGRPPKAKPFPESQAEADAAVAAKHKGDPVADVKKLGNAPYGYKKDGTPRTRRVGRIPKDEEKEHISLEQVVAVVNQHPEGVTVSEIAAIIDPEDVKQTRKDSWTIRSVENRITASLTRQKQGKQPIPFRYENRQGKRGKQRVLYPLQSEVQTESTPTPEPEPTPELPEGTFPWQQLPS